VVSNTATVMRSTPGVLGPSPRTRGPLNTILRGGTWWRVFGWRHDSGRLQSAHRPGSVHRPGRDDRRVDWRWKNSPIDAVTGTGVLDQTNLVFMGTARLRRRHGSGHRHRAPHVLRHPGVPGHDRRSRTQRLPSGCQQRELVADPFRARDGAHRVSGQRATTKGDWLQAFLFALSVAVGLTPEMLPMIVTSTTGQGCGAVVAQEGRRQAARCNSELRLRWTSLMHRQDRHTDAGQDRGGAQDRSVRCCIRRRSELCLPQQLLPDWTEEISWTLRSSVTWELASKLKLEDDYRKIDEIPFDFSPPAHVGRLVSERDEHHTLVCKGALEEVLATCTSVRTGSGTAASVDAFDAGARARALAFANSLNEEGLRVVAVAMKVVPPAQATYSVADEAGLTLIGYISSSIHPRSPRPRRCSD